MVHKNMLIDRDNEILSGGVVFTGMRVPLQAFLDYLEEGSSLDEFLEDFPTVARTSAATRVPSTTSAYFLRYTLGYEKAVRDYAVWDEGRAACA